MPNIHDIMLGTKGEEKNEHESCKVTKTGRKEKYSEVMVWGMIISFSKKLVVIL